MALEKMIAVNVEWTFVALTFFLVCLHLYFQLTRKGQLFWADGFIIMSWWFFTFQTATDWAIMHFGNATLVQDDKIVLGSLRGGKTWELTIVIAKLKYAQNVTYYSALYMVKFAWLCFFHTLIPKVLPALRITYWVVTAISVVGYAFTTLINTFYCWPISRRWAIGDKTYCSNDEWVWIVIMTIHSATDIIIYVLSILLIRHLKNLTRRTRIGVALLFALGLICVGWAFTLQVENLVNVPGPVVCISGAFEQSWAIFVVCLPSFKSLLQSGVSGLTRKREQGSEEAVVEESKDGGQVVNERSLGSNDFHV